VWARSGRAQCRILPFYKWVPQVPLKKGLFWLEVQLDECEYNLYSRLASHSAKVALTHGIFNVILCFQGLIGCHARRQHVHTGLLLPGILITSHPIGVWMYALVYITLCVCIVCSVCIQDDRLSLAIFLLSPFLCLFSFPFLFNSLSGSFSLSLGFFSLSFVFRLIFLLFRCLSRFKLHLSVCFHIYLPIYLHTYWCMHMSVHIYAYTYSSWFLGWFFG